MKIVYYAETDSLYIDLGTDEVVLTALPLVSDGA